MNRTAKVLAHPHQRPRTEPDLRLLAPVVAGWGATRLGLTLPTAVTCWLAAVCVLGGIACLCVPRGRLCSVVFFPIGVTALVAAVLVLSATLRLQAARLGPVPRLAAAGAKAQVEVVVTGDPKPVKGGLIVLPVRIEQVTTQDSSFQVRDRATVLAHPRRPQDTAAWADLLPSMHLRLKARLVTPRSPEDGDSATILASQTPEVLGGPSLLQQAAGALRADLRQAVAGLPPEASGVLPALTLGDTSAVPPSTTADLKAAGLSFLIVVSGENLVFLSAAALPLAKQVGLRAHALAVFGALLALGFTALARPGPPMVRATVTALLASTALATGRRFRGLTALAAAALILMVIDPWLAPAYGFVLSVAATAGLLISAPAWRDHLIVIHRVPRAIATTAAYTAAAEVYCEPLLVTFTGVLPLLSVPANVLAVPAAPAATVLGVGAMVGYALWPPAGHALAWLAQWPARWICLVAHTTAAIPGATVPWPDGLVGLLLLLGTYAIGRRICRTMQRGAAPRRSR